MEAGDDEKKGETDARVPPEPSGSRPLTSDNLTYLSEYSKESAKPAPTAILVLGMHRSGTSLLTSILHMLGADAPRTPMAPNVFNPKGYAESARLMEIHNRLLASAGTNWKDWARFNPDWRYTAVADAFRSDIRRAIDAEFPGTRFFAVKDPRICRFADFWCELLQGANFRSVPIIAFRNPIEVASSLQKRDKMAPQHAQLLWLQHVLAAEKSTRGRARTFVNYHDLLSDWRAVIQTITQRTFVRFPRQAASTELAIDDFVDASLRNHSSTDARATSGHSVTSWVQRVYSALIEAAQDGESPALHRVFDDIDSEFEKACAAFGVLVARLERDNEGLSDRLRDTSARLQASTEAAQSSDRSVTELMVDLDNLGKRASVAEAALAKAIQENHEKEVRQSERQSSELATMASNHKAHFDKARQEWSSILAAEQSARGRLEQLYSSLQSELQKKDAELSAQASAHREALDQLNAVSNKAQSEIATLKQDGIEKVAALQTELERQKVEFQEQETRHREATDKLSAALAAADRAAEALKRSNLHKISNLENELQRYQDTLATRETEHKVALDRIALQATEAHNLAMERVATLNQEVVAMSEAATQSRLEAADKLAAEADRHEETRQFQSKLQKALEDKCSSLESALAAANDRIASLEKIASLSRAQRSQRENAAIPHDIHVGKEADGGKKPQTIDAALSAPPDVAISDLFDAEWYRKNYRIDAKDDALEHFLTRGFRQGFDPHPLFRTRWYLETYPEVGAEGENPLVHFVTRGAKENRWPHPLFDTAWYRRTYANELGEGVNPLADFVGEGWLKGRNPNAVFDVRYYLGRNHDVRRSGINPLIHYDRFGAKEGRPASSRFDTGWYRANNPDIGAMNPLAHYLRVGLQEGRPGLPTVEEGIATTAGAQPHKADGPSILLVAHTISSSGLRFGAERSFIDMAASLSRAGCNVHVVLPGRDPSYAEALAPYARDISVFPYSWWRANNLPDDLAIARFQRLIQLKTISLVYVNTIMLREPSIAARTLGVLNAVHCRELIDQDEQLASVVGAAPDQIVEDVVERADLIIANSRATAALYGKRGKTPHIVPNIVDVERFRDRARSGSEGTTKVGIISSNLSKKGILDFAEVSKRLSSTPNIEFHVYGPETDVTRELRRRKAAGELPASLVFDGYVDEPAAVLANLDIVLCLSSFAESFGRTIAEAMAAKCLVISYRLGAVPELIEHNKTGLLVDVGNVSGVADLISDFRKNPKRFEGMRAEARSFVEKFHVPAVMDARYVDILNLLEITGDTSRYTSPVPTGYAERAKSRKLSLRVAYFCWHFPVPSETFVLNELRVLKQLGHEVHVFCRQSPYPEFKPDFEVPYSRVSTPEELADALRAFRADIAHGHFVYPTVTDFLWPAAERAGIDFTFIAHAQDIFKYSNAEKNRIAEIGRSPRCLKVFTLSRFHRDFLEQRGVPGEKLAINSNGVDPDLFRMTTTKRGPRKSIFSVCRFVEKKGLTNLVEAARRLDRSGIDIYLYGYGEGEDKLRAQAKLSGAKNVIFAGRIANRSQLLDAFAKHDLCICPAVRTPDGDMDGIPTVLMEAMAAGVPVMATNISGIPDLVIEDVTGFNCGAQPEEIAASVEHFFSLSPGRVARTVAAAQAHVREHYDVKKLVNNMVRVWRQETIDIVIVSWNNLPELKEVVTRLLRYTSFPYRLIICDNNSEPVVIAYLRELEQQQEQIVVRYNTSNDMVGPGTNAAMAIGSSEFVVYVCGKEGFALDFNWEHPFYYGLRDNPEAGLVGTLCYSPSYLSGRDMVTNNKRFGAFRNQDFARENPDREFLHIQGGLFGMRRSAIESLGGFSNDVPHDGTDIEMSYVLESAGWRLQPISGMVAIYNKTRPDLTARVDESTRILHPPTLSDLPWLDALVRGKTALCPICAWRGHSFIGILDAHVCPNCGSTEDDRSVWRYLAQSTLTYRRLPAVAIGIGSALLKPWKEQFQGSVWTQESFISEINAQRRLPNRSGGMALALVAKVSELSDESQRLVLKELHRLLDTTAGRLVVVDASEFLESPIFNELGFVLMERSAFSSQACRFGWRTIGTFRTL